MGREIVPWRHVITGLVAVVLGAVGVVVVARANGFQAIDATIPRATRWFADRASGRVVLVDGYAGRALARLEPDAETRVDEVVQGGDQATLLDRSSSITRVIDGAALKLGPSQPLPAMGGSASVVQATQAGLVVVNPSDAEAVVVPPGGTPISVQIASDTEPGSILIAPDGAAWTRSNGTVRRTSTTQSDVVFENLKNGMFSLVGNTPLVVNFDTTSARIGDGAWVALPPETQLSELVAQRPGPDDDCGWIGADNTLMCVGRRGLEQVVVVDGLDIDGGDLLSIAGDAGVVVDRSAGTIIRLDWRNGAILETQQAGFGAASNLRLSASVDLVWVDAIDGQTVWTINPWGMTAINKNDASTPLLGESGDLISSPNADGGAGNVVDESNPEQERSPDENGLDDPPVAVDDNVSSRAGTAVPIAVTANDFDPDGQAVAVVSVTNPTRGTVDIASAGVVTYQPQSDTAGKDQFQYTIVDAAGQEATATVTLNLLSADAPNQAPSGADDFAQTGPDRAVIVDVLLNDVDPERDALRIDTFTGDQSAGLVEEVIAPSGLPGLRFEPSAGFSGRATFSYVPMDALGASGDPVSVVVDVAPSGAENRSPVTKPDAIRLRRNVTSRLDVLANDVDPDGDALTLELVDPLPESIDVDIDGVQLVVTAQAGSRPLSAMQYRVLDGRGGVALGSVLIAVLDDREPNRPPVANADTATAVAGATVEVDVLLNDSDPDGDPLVIVDASTNGAGTVVVDGDRLVYTAAELRGDGNEMDRFTYRISDGQGHEVEGYVSMRILPERLPRPPVALDDSASTEMDKPVLIDVLRNDTDPSGDSPTIVGRPGCAAGGTAVVTTDERVQFNPPRGRSGLFRCSYEIANASGLRANGAINITVIEPALTNQPPVVISEERTVGVGQTIAVDVLANDSDPDGDSDELKLVNSTEPISGKAVREGSTITYTAPATPTVVSISYDVGDAAGAIASGRLIIRVTGGSKQPPIAVADSRSVEANTSKVAIDVLANDSDPDGPKSALRVSSVQLVAGAATVSVEDNRVVFALEPGARGQVSARYSITDSDRLTANGLVTVSIISASNRPPVAAADYATVVAGESVLVQLALNDSDPDGDPLTYKLLSVPQANLGSATLTGSSLRFAALPGANGTASLEYEASDGVLTASAKVSIEVVGCSAAPPQATDAFLTTGYRQPIAIDLNKYAANGRVTTVSGAISTASAVYTPPEGENGNVTVSFTVENACGDSDSGTITIDVNQDPSASPLTLKMGRTETRTVSVKDLASDAEPLVISSLVGAPSWVVLSQDRQSFAVAPKGASGREDFEAIVRDPGGLTAAVPVSIRTENAAPVANDDTIDTSALSLSFSLLDNDEDPDGDSIRYQSLPKFVTFSNNQRVELRRNDSQLTMDLGLAEGEATFQYSIVDAFSKVSNLADVKIVVKRTTPVAKDVTVSVEAGSSASVDANVSDADGETIEVRVAPSEVPDGLTVNISGLRFEILVDKSVGAGEYRIPYTARDPGGRQSSASIIVIVTTAIPVNPPTSTSSTSPVTSTSSSTSSSTSTSTSTTDPADNENQTDQTPAPDQTQTPDGGVPASATTSTTVGSG